MSRRPGVTRYDLAGEGFREVAAGRDGQLPDLALRLVQFAVELLLRGTEYTVEQLSGLELKFVPKARDAVHENIAAIVAKSLSIPRRSRVALLVRDSIYPFVTLIAIERGLHFGSF